MRTILVLFLLLGITGCASVQSYVQEFNVISIDQEKQISDQASVEIAKEMKISKDSSANERVNRIGKKLVAGLPHQDFEYRFYVVEDKTPNAFAIPGARIYVHTGLLDFVDDDDELAGVLAHEIGHAYERHPAKAMSRAYGVDYLSTIVFKKTPENQSAMNKITVAITKGTLLNKYGRDDEREADEIGFYLLRDTGYQKDGLMRFLHKLQNMNVGNAPVPFLSSHPPTPERIARLEKLSQDAPSVITTPTPASG